MNSLMYISHNPDSSFEQSLALQIQILSLAHGLSVQSPERNGSDKLNDETKDRILNSKYFFLFLESEISEIVLREINFALSMGKKVLIIFDARQTHKFHVHTDWFHESPIIIGVNPERDDVGKIMGTVFSHLF